MIALKSILHNLAVVAVGFVVALVGLGLDRLFALAEFRSISLTVIGSVLICIGFLIRAWATYFFYKNHMRVIVTTAQETLITSGPYHFSRNPLYLGGNGFIFLGAALLLGSPAAVLITIAHLPLVDLFIRREEQLLERDFGDEWRRYRRQVRRWL